MHEDFGFSDFPYLEIADFSVFHLNIDEAAELIVKILGLKGEIDVEIPENEEGYSLKDPILNDILIKEIENFVGILTSGIENGTLKTARILRDIYDNIYTDETFINTDVLIKWLEERSIYITGDWYEEYFYDELKVAEAAINAIQVQRAKNKNKQEEPSAVSEEQKVEFLEQKLLLLQAKLDEKDRPRHVIKPLHVKERESLLKMIAGMAVDGYGYDPSATRSPIPKEIAEILAEKGMPLDPDTVRKWLKEAAEFFPQEIESSYK